MSTLPVPAQGLDFDTFSGAVCEMADQLGLPEELVFPFLDASFHFVNTGEMPSATVPKAAATEPVQSVFKSADEVYAAMLQNFEKFGPAGTQWRTGSTAKKVLGLISQNEKDNGNACKRDWVVKGLDKLASAGHLKIMWTYSKQLYSTPEAAYAAGLDKKQKAQARRFVVA